MRHTARETTTQTLTRLIKAADRQHPVTITYVKADGTTTVRTIETYDIAISNAGDVLLKAMDRQSGESRTFRLDRLVSYTIHRTSYQIERTATGDKPAYPAYELAATIAPRATGISATTRMNNLAAAFAA
jgi:predicted DNA-binding transcriptional regulator YafY